MVKFSWDEWLSFTWVHLRLRKVKWIGDGEIPRGNEWLFFRVYLSRQAEGHWEEGVITDSGGIKGRAPGRIEAGFAHDVADEAEDEDEEEDEGGGDEEGWEEALDAEGRGDDGSQDAQGRHAEHPHARDHAIQNGHLHDTHPFLPSFVPSFLQQQQQQQQTVIQYLLHILLSFPFQENYLCGCRGLLSLLCFLYI